MIERTNHTDSLCGVAKPPDVIGDGQSLLIVRNALDGLRRLGGFQRNLGLSKNILAVCLRNLAAHNILETVPAPDGSAYQDYALTEKRRALFPLLVALRQWGEAFRFAPDETHVVLVGKATGKPVSRLELRTQDGHALVPEDTVVAHPSAIRPTKRQQAKAG